MKTSSRQSSSRTKSGRTSAYVIFFRLRRHQLLWRTGKTKLCRSDTSRRTSMGRTWSSWSWLIWAIRYDRNRCDRNRTKTKSYNISSRKLCRSHLISSSSIQKACPRQWTVSKISQKLLKWWERRPRGLSFLWISFRTSLVKRWAMCHIDFKTLRWKKWSRIWTWFGRRKKITNSWPLNILDRTTYTVLASTIGSSTSWTDCSWMLNFSHKTLQRKCSSKHLSRL